MDKLYREIESITTGARESLDSSLKSSTENGSSAGITVYKKKRARGSDGTVNENNDIIVDKVSLESWAINELNEFFAKWQSVNYDVGINGFDGAILEDNNYSSKIVYGGTEIRTPLTIALVKYSKILFSTVQNLTSHDVVTDINDRTVEDGDAVYDNSQFRLKTSIGRSTFESSDDYAQYANNFDDVSASVSFWLSYIRNHKNPELLAGAVPVRLDIRIPSYDVDKSTDNYNSTPYYTLTTKWHELDILGYEGDNIEHAIGGYSWNILSDSISTGMQTYAQGLNSLTIGTDATAAGENSIATMATIATDTNSSAFGWGTWAGYFAHSFISAVIDESSSPSGCILDCNDEGQRTSSTIKIAINGTSASSEYVTTENENGVYLFRATDKNGNLIKKTLKGTVVKIESASTAGNESSRTVLTIRLQEGQFNTLSSGYISRITPASSNVKSRFVLGQFNKPNPGAIFQIGTGINGYTRDTFVEVGFDSDGLGDRYFKIGLDTLNNNIIGSKTIDYLRVVDDSVYAAIGNSKMILDDDTGISFGNPNGGYLMLKTSDATVNIVNKNSLGYIKLSDTLSTIRALSHQIDLHSSGYVDMSSTGNINFQTSASLSITAGTNIHLSSRSHDTITLGTVGQNQSTNFSGTSLRFDAIDTTLDLQGHYINTNTALVIRGAGDMVINGGTLNINSFLRIDRTETSSNTSDHMRKLWSKNPNTGYSHAVYSAVNQGMRSIPYSGFYRLRDTHGYGIPNSYFPSARGNHILANYLNSSSGWFMGTDSVYLSNTDTQAIWTRDYSPTVSSEWRRLAYRDEVASMGMVIDYKYVGAFAEFNINENDEDTARSLTKVSNFCVIRTQSVAYDNTVYSSTASDEGSTVRYLDMDYSTSTPFVNIAESNSNNPTLGSNSTNNKFIVGVKTASPSPNGYREQGTLYFEYATFSKVGHTVFFDISVIFNEIDDNITSEQDKRYEYGIVFVLGKNNKELMPTSSHKFQQQNKSLLNYRYGMQISPFGDSEGTSFVITRQDQANLEVYDESRSTARNAAGIMGSHRAHFTGQYTAYNDTQLPYLILDNQ